MILTCPSCTTRYQVDAARFAPPGRQVRCAKCGHAWFQGTPDAEITPEPEAEPVVVMPAAEPEFSQDDMPPPGSYAANTGLEDTRPRKPKRPFAFGRVAGWLVLLLVIAGIVFVMLSFRMQIATVWPQSSSFYSTVGMPVNVRGLAFSDVTYQMTTEDGQPVLSLAGKLANVTEHELPLPMLRVDLNDDQKRSLYHWTFDTGAATLPAGGSLQFVTRLSNPPVETRSLQLRFADAGDDPGVVATPTTDPKPKP